MSLPLSSPASCVTAWFSWFCLRIFSAAYSLHHPATISFLAAPLPRTLVPCTITPLCILFSCGFGSCLYVYLGLIYARFSSAGCSLTFRTKTGLLLPCFSAKPLVLTCFATKLLISSGFCHLPLIYKRAWDGSQGVACLSHVSPPLSLHFELPRAGRAFAFSSSLDAAPHRSCCASHFLYAFCSAFSVFITPACTKTVQQHSLCCLLYGFLRATCRRLPVSAALLLHACNTCCHRLLLLSFLKPFS